MRSRSGHQSTKLVSLNETRLDEHYMLAGAQFVCALRKALAQPIDVEVDSTFILYVKDGVPKIVFQHGRHRRIVKQAKIVRAETSSSCPR